MKVFNIYESFANENVMYKYIQENNFPWSYSTKFNCILHNMNPKNVVLLSHIINCENVCVYV